MDFSHLTIEKFLDTSVIKQFEDKLAELIFYDDQPEGLKIYLALEKRLNELDLKNIRPEIYAKYQEILLELKFLSFAIMAQEESLRFIEENLGKLIQNKFFDLNERIKLRLVGCFDFQTILYKESILRILRKSQARIGNKFVADWLLNYNQVAGARKHNNVERTEYMIKNKETQMLNEQNKVLLRKILTLYDEMKVEVLKLET